MVCMFCLRCSRFFMFSPIQDYFEGLLKMEKAPKALETAFPFNKVSGNGRLPHVNT